MLLIEPNLTITFLGSSTTSRHFYKSSAKSKFCCLSEFWFIFLFPRICFLRLLVNWIFFNTTTFKTALESLMNLSLSRARAWRRLYFQDRSVKSHLVERKEKVFSGISEQNAEKDFCCQKKFRWALGFCECVLDTSQNELNHSHKWVQKRPLLHLFSRKFERNLRGFRMIQFPHILRFYRLKLHHNSSLLLASRWNELQSRWCWWRWRILLVAQDFYQISFYRSTELHWTLSRGWKFENLCDHSTLIEITCL